MARILRVLVFLLTLASAAALGLWAVGRINTDHSLWTQYLFWVPTWAYLGATAAALALASMLAIGLRRTKRRRVWRRFRLATLLVWFAAAGWLLAVDLRLLNLLQDQPARGPLRILHWNVTGMESLDTVKAALRRERPDVAVFVNPSGRNNWHEMIQSASPPVAIAWGQGMLVIARVPIRRYGFTWLDLARLPVDAPVDWTPHSEFADPGRAMWVELDTTEQLGRPTTVLVYDMPSDLRRWRWKLALNARNALSEWAGPITLRDEQGGTTRQDVEEFGFPPADLVTGDFNIPRGSASLRLLAPGMTNAFDQAGSGYAATYPRWRPLVHIDQTFTGQGLRAVRYRIRNPGPPSSHFYQVTDIAPAALP